MDNVLFTGGNGILGLEMRKLFLKSHFPSSDELDITDDGDVWSHIADCGEIDTVVHLAAFTGSFKVTNHPMQALAINMTGTCHIVEACASVDKRLIYISTDHVFDGKKGNYKEDDPVHPINTYAWSKLGGECAVRLYKNSLIVRLSFGPDEFPFNGAFTDQWTSKEPVSITARRLEKLIKSDITGTINIGSERRTVYEYAKSVAPEKPILEMSVKNLKTQVPIDTSLDVSKYNSLFPED